ncbi:MAG TPA: hypothetical protein VGW78_02450 [Candidatus Babeliales bacterium]|jgi:hypothetical protein|nr:hypothetical protein [Candidatus Babeliales bacterium]
MQFKKYIIFGISVCSITNQLLSMDNKQSGSKNNGSNEQNKLSEDSKRSLYRIHARNQFDYQKVKDEDKPSIKASMTEATVPERNTCLKAVGKMLPVIIAPAIVGYNINILEAKQILYAITGFGTLWLSVKCLEALGYQLRLNTINNPKSSDKDITNIAQELLREHMDSVEVPAQQFPVDNSEKVQCIVGTTVKTRHFHETNTNVDIKVDEKLPWNTVIHTPKYFDTIVSGKSHTYRLIEE